MLEDCSISRVQLHSELMNNISTNTMYNYVCELIDPEEIHLK